MAVDWSKVMGGVLGAATGGLFSLAQPLIAYGLGAYDQPKPPPLPTWEESMAARPAPPLVPLSSPGGATLVMGSPQTPMPPTTPMQPLTGLPPLPAQSPWAAPPTAGYTPPPSTGLVNLARRFG